MDISEHVKLYIYQKVRETENAWQIKLLNGEIYWFPKSQCRIIDNYILVPEWLIIKNNIEVDNED